jgi:prepilin-type N-terminal cleavage/methylation domain-containing protein
LFALSRRAYTLIELVLVLGIMVVIAAMAAPRFGDSIARQRADGAASRIVSDLNYARALARMTSASVTVTFDPTRDKYTIPTAADPLCNTPAPYVIDLGASPYRVNMLGGAAAPAGGAMPNTGSGNSTFSITFDGFGEASATGWIVVQAGNWSREVSLDSSARATITRLSASDVRALLP